MAKARSISAFLMSLFFCLLIFEDFRSAPKVAPGSSDSSDLRWLHISQHRCMPSDSLGLEQPHQHCTDLWIHCIKAEVSPSKRNLKWLLFSLTSVCNGTLTCVCVCVCVHTHTHFRECPCFHSEYTSSSVSFSHLQQLLALQRVNENWHSLGTVQSWILPGTVFSASIIQTSRTHILTAATTKWLNHL